MPSDSRWSNVHADRGICQGQQYRRHLRLESAGNNGVSLFTSVDVDGLLVNKSHDGEQTYHPVVPQVGHSKGSDRD